VAVRPRRRPRTGKALLEILERWDAELDVDEPGSLDTVARVLGARGDPPDGGVRWDLRPNPLLTDAERALAARYRRIYPWIEEGTK